MSQYERYTSIDTSTNATVFEFTSTGPKGAIKKIIQFSRTTAPDIFNLAFGNMALDGSIDDTTANDNKDRDKILATVASAVLDFTDTYPDYYVFFTGSSAARTRLYRMAITINYPILVNSFNIWGLREDKKFEIFGKHREYTGFLIKKK